MRDNTPAPSRAQRGHVAVIRLPRSEPAELDACSICLRVRHDEQWIEADTAMRLWRSYEYAAPPRLLPAICDRCAAQIALRRSDHHTLARAA
jgi:hypothetical protein